MNFFFFFWLSGLDHPASGQNWERDTLIRDSIPVAFDWQNRWTFRRYFLLRKDLLLGHKRWQNILSESENISEANLVLAKWHRETQRDKAPGFASQKENVDAWNEKILLKHKRQCHGPIRKESDTWHQELGLLRGRWKKWPTICE